MQRIAFASMYQYHISFEADHRVPIGGIHIAEFIFQSAIIQIL